MGISVDKKLRKLFDYQRFENDEKLNGVIEDVRNNISRRALSDDELELAAGGKELKDEGKIPEAYCRICKKWVPVKMFTGMRYVSSCNHNVDDSQIRYVDNH